MKYPAAIHDLKVSFEVEDNTLTPVDEINFFLRPGETLALLGESGCGKSLTALALMRLLPDDFVYGATSEVCVDDTDLLDLPESMMRSFRGRRLAIVFQEPSTSLNPVLSIETQMAEAVSNHTQLSGKALHERVLSLLKTVEMPDPELKLQQYPHQLSGGQKQRVVIAMALANDPEILIADEPTTALDVTIQAQILTLLKKLQQQKHMSVLLITHDLGVVKVMADRICIMYAGQIVEEAEVDRFFADVKHPYSKQLMASLPDATRRGMRLQAISGQVPALDALPSGCRFHPRCAYVFKPCKTEVPELQTGSARAVRCHLYPEHVSLPEFPVPALHFVKKKATGQVLLEVDHLKIHYKTSQSWHPFQKSVLKAVDGLSFKLSEGRTLALVGESGCGKTTVSRALLKLQKWTSGTVTFRGQDVAHLRGHALKDYRKRVQIIFQDPYLSMNPRMSVADILAEGLLAQGERRRNIRVSLLKLLDQTGLPANSLNRYPHQFSGGQRQRICIARALAVEPEILICDEPTSALDISVQAQILNLFKELQIEKGLSYLFITHNMSVVSYLADEVLVMRQGLKVEEGSCEDIFNAPKADYTKTLLSSVLMV